MKVRLYHSQCCCGPLDLCCKSTARPNIAKLRISLTSFRLATAIFLNMLQYQPHKRTTPTANITSTLHSLLFTSHSSLYYPKYNDGFKLASYRLAHLVLLLCLFHTVFRANSTGCYIGWPPLPINQKHIPITGIPFVYETSFDYVIWYYIFC